MLDMKLKSFFSWSEGHLETRKERVTSSALDGENRRTNSGSPHPPILFMCKVFFFKKSLTSRRNLHQSLKIVFLRRKKNGLEDKTNPT